MQQVRKGMVPHEVYNEVMPCYKAQWPVNKKRTKRDSPETREKHNIRTTCMSPTTKTKNKNSTRSITTVVHKHSEILF